MPQPPHGRGRIWSTAAQVWSSALSVVHLYRMRQRGCHPGGHGAAGSSSDAAQTAGVGPRLRQAGKPGALSSVWMGGSGGDAEGRRKGVPVHEMQAGMVQNVQ